MSSMLYSKYNIEIWNFHIIAFCFYSQFVQCPNSQLLWNWVCIIGKWKCLGTAAT